MGVQFVVAGVVACILVGCLLDRYSKFLLSLRLVCFGACTTALVAAFVFPLGSILFTTINMIAAGISIVPVIPVCISFASEVTFPMQAAMINGGV
jgi:hypothetical protein